MPFRIFHVPVHYSESATTELNAFIASHRVVHIDRKWIEMGDQSAWVFCIEYTGISTTQEAGFRGRLNRNRIDYKTILKPDEFTVFSLLRELRKELSQQEGVPVFALFTNEQLAQMVQRRCSSKADLHGIEGIGEAKVDKYSERLLTVLTKYPRPASGSEL